MLKSLTKVAGTALSVAFCEQFYAAVLSVQDDLYSS